MQKLLNAWQKGQERLRKIRGNPDSRLMRLSRIALRIAFAGYLVFCAIFLSVRYIVLPQISQYKPNVEKMLSDGFGRQVTISRIDASWYGFHPLLKLNELVIHDPEGNPALQLPQVTAEISWWSFFVFDLRLAHLEINRPELDIRRDKSGNLFVAGLPADTSTRKKGGGMDWVLVQDKITIRDGTIRWLDEMRDAPELALKDLNFILVNDGRQHRMRFIAHSSITQSGEIDIRADFVHPMFAERISDTSAWKGNLYVALPAAELDPWKPYVDFPYGLKRGAGAVNAWMTFDHARIADLTVDIDLKDVIFQFEPHLPVLDLVHISGRLSAKELFDASAVSDNLSLGDRPHTVALSDIFLETADGIRMESLDFSERHMPATDGKPASTEITTDELDLGTLIQMTKYLPLSAEQRKMLNDFSPSGELNHFTIRWEGQYPDLVSYQLNGKFKNLSMNAVAARSARAATAKTPAQAAIPAIPGFKNLTGGISANEYGGSLELDSDAATLNMPSYFPKSSWNFDALKLLANWSFATRDEFIFVIEKMDFSLDGISVSLFGRHVKPTGEDEKSAPGKIDMTATVKSIDMTNVRNYVPLQTKEVLRTWLTKAFEEGTASNITVHLKGDLAEFPFAGAAKAPGSEFSVRMDVSNVRLNHAPTMLTREGKLMWQPIDKINGWLTIKGGEIVIHADNAILSGAMLSNVDVVIPDMLAEDASLNITGNANGELQDFIRFVNASPVNDVIGGLTEESKTMGKTSLLLKMQMPLSNMANSKVQGTVQFADNEIHLFPDLPVLTAVRGKVHFSDKGFELNGVNAQFLGGNVSITGGTKDGRSQVNASGTLTADGLRRNYPGGSMGKMMRRLSGSMPYTLSIAQKAGSQGGGYPDIVLESGMNGLGIDLPAPLGKKASETRQLRVTANAIASMGKARRDEIRIAYGSGAAAHYERQKTDKIWQLVRGGLGINMKPVLHPGVSLNLKMPSLDMNVWQESLDALFADDGKGKGASKGGADIGKYVEPQQFFIQVDELSAMEFKLSNAVITGSRQAGRWQADVDANELKGQLIWTEPTGKQATGKLTGRFATLAIPRSSPEKIEDIVKRDSVRQIPALDLVVDNFTLFDIKLGRIELVANNTVGPTGREWRINRLSVSNPDARLQSTGNWVVDHSGAQHTRMNYDLDIVNAGKLLDRFGYKGILSGGKGKMHGDISWAGLPYSLDIPSLSGKIDLNVGKGQFLKVDPGMAKLLGVLSMQSLPRRLTLDFRDVFSDGFAFDEIVAKAEITKGVARTENLTMKGVQATVLMDGSVDIARETQNLHVAVLPEINAGAASLAYSVINPAIGVGTFLAQLFLKDPLSKTFTFEYQITGSWAEPNIQKIESKDSRAKKFMDAIKPENKDEI
ncbi:TIGR02099 family protein [Oxalobacter vibrioformis]|uniref:TIGR02099 family protein n=1 Tax=Oxalobacter vibrioformis TaxID=933080 RepID=A0A9E9M0Y5_9BURK|nr:YhdP family protein [Oxalobacter vibrioformis]WAW11152.1 TIGR02099 family protein [Oxalobacter vibrioformis]